MRGQKYQALLKLKTSFIYSTQPRATKPVLALAVTVEKGSVLQYNFQYRLEKDRNGHLSG